MTAEYPEKVTTQLKSAVNNLSLNLADDVGENDDEIIVQSTEGTPASGSFHIENEIIFYPEKTSIKFGPGLTRGADGTTKAVHLKTLAGGEVKFGPEAHFINNLNDEVIATQTKLGITGAFNFVGKTGDEVVAGVKTLSDTPKMDAIAEKTADAGVTVDGVLIKDSLDVSGIVAKTGVQTIAGVKTFSDNIVLGNDKMIQTNIKARAYLSSAQNDLVSGTWTKVTLNAETYDVGADFDIANYRFVVPVPGYYLTYGQVRFINVVADKQYGAGIWINVEAACRAQIISHTALVADLYIPVFNISYLTAADVVYLYAISVAGVNTVDLSPIENSTFMTVHLLSV